MNTKIWQDLTITNKLYDEHYGEIYKAIDTNGNLFCIKYFLIDRTPENINKLVNKKIVDKIENANKYIEEMTRNIRNEIYILQKLSGSMYAIKIYDYKEINSDNGLKTHIYIKMEYLTPAIQSLNNMGIKISEVIKIGIDICDSLELLNTFGIYHNNIKPDTIFVTSNGQYKLGDFGFATYNSSNFIKIGTKNYAAPEKVNLKKVYKNSELYSLGLVLYCLISGQLPSEEKNKKNTFKINHFITKKIKNLSNIDKNLMNILRKSLYTEAKKRYETPNMMKKDLLKINRVQYLDSEIIRNQQHNIDELEDTIDINSEELIKKSYTFENKLFVEKIKRSKFTIGIINFFSYRPIPKLIFLLFFGIIIFNVSQKILTGRSCKEGYINRNGTCVKGHYYCDEGYDLVNDNCRKVVSTEEAKMSYECPYNYTLYDNKCIYNDIRDPEFVYKCADGFTLNGEKCEKIESANALETFTCPTGYILSGNKCFKLENVTATVKYYCSHAKYQLINDKCKLSETIKEKPTIRFACETGGILENQECEYKMEPKKLYGNRLACKKGRLNLEDKMCHYREKAKRQYYCNNGEYMAGECIIKNEEIIDANIRYICPENYMSVANQCVKTKGINAKVKYLCADDMILENKKCYSKITTDAVGIYECDEGYVASGIKCYKNDFPSPEEKYLCSKAYTLNGKICEKYKFKEKKPFYEK